MSQLLEPAGDLRELKLHELRREAERNGHVERAGIRASGAPFPLAQHASATTGYYGMPLLKSPSWKWQIPAYFFTGGLAGAAAVIAGVSRLSGADMRLVRDARMLAAIGAQVSPALLIADLGMPSRFLNMLRVFKFQSPMSVGAWTHFAFSSSSSGLAFLEFAKRRGRFLRVIETAADVSSVISGGVLASYTGVLLGATAVPVWNKNVAILPIHFAASGMGTAASILELRGNQSPALNALSMASAIAETAVGASIEMRKDRALTPLKKGKSGWLTRIGGLLSGPLPLALRILSYLASDRRKTTLRKAAAASAIAGSVITRFAWTEAGKASASDPRISLELPD